MFVVYHDGSDLFVTTKEKEQEFLEKECGKDENKLSVFLATYKREEMFNNKISLSVTSCYDEMHSITYE